MRLPIFLLTFFPILLSAAQPPAARFELVSVPQVSQTVSRMGNCIAPRFRDTVAAVTLILSAGAVQCGMDPTRPMEIRFYSFGERPVMRITAFAVEHKGDLPARIKLAGCPFQVKEKGKLIILDSNGISEPLPTVLPGNGLKEGELIRGTVQADAVRRHFRFSSFNAKDTSANLILRGVDELLTQAGEAAVVFSADEKSLKVELTVRPKKTSALSRWMQQPLPPKGRIEVFDGAQTLAVLRLDPTGTLRQYAAAYLGKSFPASLAASANGFAAMASGSSRKYSSMRVNAGIRPDPSAGLQKEIRKLKPTPFDGWFQLRNNPTLLISLKPDGLLLFGADGMDSTLLHALDQPREFTKTLPDVPFVCLDLADLERPLAELRIDRGSLRLILQAKDQWFAAHGPLLEKPLLLPERK